MNQENIFDKQRRAIYYELMQIGLEQQECWAEADLTLKHVTGLKREQQIISNLDEFKTDWLHEITRIIDLRRERRPLAYCLHEVEFAGLMFRIVPGVLIPRTDTEALVEAVVNRLGITLGMAENTGRLHRPLQAPAVGADYIRPLHESTTPQGNLKNPAALRIAEIGVGSGAIAITLLKRLPNCTVWACDTSETAVTLTLGNARRHNVDDRLTLVHGDWEKVLPDDFDIIVSNPPYLPLSLLTDPQCKLQPELAFEPKSALFDGSKDGLTFYHQFAEKLPAHFARGVHPVGVDAIDPLSNTGTAAETHIEICDSGLPLQFLHPPLQEDKVTPFAAFEFGDKQEQSILKIFNQNGWQNLSISHDINGLPRVLTAIHY